MKNRKFLIILGSIVLVSLVGVGIFSIANKIVDNAYSSREVVVKENTVNWDKEKPVDDTEGSEPATEVKATEEEKPKMELENTEEDVDISKAKYVYDPTNLEGRRDAFFGSEYAKYEKVLNGIYEMSDDIFSKMSLKDIPPYSKFDIYKVYGAEGTSGFDFADIKDFKALSLQDAMTVIDMYGKTRLVCAYNYPNNPCKSLLCIDLSEHEFPAGVGDQITVFDFGEESDFFVNPCIGRVEYIDGWSVLFVKG